MAWKKIRIPASPRLGPSIAAIGFDQLKIGLTKREVRVDIPIVHRGNPRFTAAMFCSDIARSIPQGCDKFATKFRAGLSPGKEKAPQVRGFGEAPLPGFEPGFPD
jgi:hypothetical protein